MDEQAAPTKPKQRLLGFYGAHLLFNFLALVPLVFCLICLGLTNESDPMRTLLCLPCLFSLAVYFPLGMWLAKWKKWTVPTRKDNLLTTLLPAVVSALCVVLITLFPVPISTGSGSFVLFFLFNVPQTVFVFSATVLLDSSLGALLFVLVPTLFLPSLLFALGSFWQSRQALA